MERFQIPLLLLIACVCSASTESGFACKEAERNALLKLKHSFFDAQNLLGSWVGEECCSWKGVGCNNLTSHVTNLDLRGNWYSLVYKFDAADFSLEDEFYLEAGEVNPALLELKYLTYLDLSGNDFSFSPIPEFLGSMGQLQYLNLSHAWFGGKVPHSLGNLTKLVVLDLGLSWGLETDSLKWTFKLKNLQHLDLSGFDLSQALDSLNILHNLPSLSVLNLENCKLGNSHLVIRNSTVSSSPLQHLNLKYNLFSSLIPHFIQNLSSIRFLDLSFNSFYSQIPSWLGNKVDLEYLNLRGNSFNGSFPHLLQNSTFLSSLDLSYNQFSSSIPSWVAKKRYLKYLHLRHNLFDRVDGGVMNTIGSLCSLIQLDLSFNQLQEEVLESHDNFPRCRRYGLEYLSMQNNNMSGHLPIIGAFKSLQHLNLSNNNFKIIPESFGELSSLTSIDLSDNDIEDIPESFGELSSLTSIDLSHNAFEVIPKSFGNLSSLAWIDLSDNNIEDIPASFGKLSSLLRLDLSNNHLSVVHQVSFQNLSSLRSLDISLNNVSLEYFSPDWLPPFQLASLRMLPCKFNGPFPKWILGQYFISNLDLSDTGIIGPLPNNISNSMTYLRHLKLAENNINGSIPVSLCKLASLEVLDLKKNRLTGMIPDCLVNSSQILAIEFSSNKLSGPIPKFEFGTLQLLSLSNNSLEGELPSSLSTCENLMVLDVGKNNLHGRIPPWNGVDFPALRILILRENKFMGVIPPQLCSIHTFQIIDLASNALVGGIPRCFGHFPYMGSFASPPSPNALMTLKMINPNAWSAVEVMKGEEREYTTVLHLLVSMDLSCNNLVGVIPTEITSLSLVRGLNLSHNHFTGAIPKEIGKMKSLESLDLSFNNLSGSIPESISSINSLSALNLSFNNLQGQIPTGSQLQTLPDPSIYMGNPGLCGDLLPRKCVGDNIAQPPTSTVVEDKDEDSKHERMWFYLVIMSGFATGFWGVIGVLVVKRSWRHAFFQLAEELADWLYVRVAVWVAQIRGK